MFGYIMLDTSITYANKRDATYAILAQFIHLLGMDKRILDKFPTNNMPYDYDPSTFFGTGSYYLKSPKLLAFAR